MISNKAADDTNENSNRWREKSALIIANFNRLLKGHGCLRSYSCDLVLQVFVCTYKEETRLNWLESSSAKFFTNYDRIGRTDVIACNLLVVKVGITSNVDV